MPLSHDEATKLYNHVRAIEQFDSEIQEIQADKNDRKAIAKAEGFDTNVITAIVKRRKNGEGQTMAFDALLEEYEDAIKEQKDLQLGDEKLGSRTTFTVRVGSDATQQ